MKKLGLLLLPLLFCGLFLQGCQQKPEYTWHSEVLTGYFDTLITFVGYTKTEEEFDIYLQLVESEFARLHELYDIYRFYPGVNNLKTVNDMAGIEPVKVADDLLNMVKFAQDWTTNNRVKTNIALGPVLAIWHRYREDGLADPENAQLPSQDELEEAAKHTDPGMILIDEKAATIYLTDKQMSLDVGALAKGYATELVAGKLVVAGLTAGALNTGGNVRTIGSPRGKDLWGIGIMDPNKPLFAEDRNLDTVYVADQSVVSSGDYQRYYYVEGVRYHHLIDPSTLMPADFYRAITVVTADSGWADLLSTELFLWPYEESRQLADSLQGVEVLWIMPDGQVRFTQGMADLLASQGAVAQD